MKQMDANGDGAISFEEFMRGFSDLAQWDQFFEDQRKEKFEAASLSAACSSPVWGATPAAQLKSTQVTKVLGRGRISKEGPGGLAPAPASTHILPRVASAPLSNEAGDTSNSVPAASGKLSVLLESMTSAQEFYEEVSSSRNSWPPAHRDAVFLFFSMYFARLFY
jgi:hypothetical protein